MAVHGQQFENLVIVVNKAFGGKEDDSPPKADPATAPKTPEALEAILMERLG